VTQQWVANCSIVHTHTHTHTYGHTIGHTFLGTHLDKHGHAWTNVACMQIFVCMDREVNKVTKTVVVMCKPY
jgi:hypothetical protein